MSSLVDGGVIALFFGHVASNIGDLAINRGQVSLIRKIFPKASIRVVLLGDPKSNYLERSKESFGDVRGLEFVRFQYNDKLASRYTLDPGKFLNDCGVGDAELVALAAGEHLFSYSNYCNFRNLFWRTLPAFAARQLKLPCIQMPSTFGPFQSEESLRIIEAFFRTDIHAAVRETISAELLRGVTESGRVPALLDPAFFIEEPAANRNKDRKVSDRRIVGLAMRSETSGLRLTKGQRDKLSSESEQCSTALQFATSFATQCLNAGNSLRIFAQTEIDKALAERVVLNLSTHDHSERIETVAPETVSEYLASLRETDGIVASRFHALVLALVVGRPCFGVYFDVHGHKIPGLMNLLGEEASSVDITNVDVNWAAKQALNSVSTASVLSEELKSRIDHLKQMTLNWLSEFKHLDSVGAVESTSQDAISAMSPIAVSVSESGEKAASSQLIRLSRFKSRFNELNTQYKALMSENRRNIESISSLQQQIAKRTGECEALKQSIKDAEESLLETEKSWSLRVANLETESIAAKEQIAARERDLGVLRSKVRRDRLLAIEKEVENKKKQEILKDRVREIEQSESFRIGYAIVRVVTIPRKLVRRFLRPSDSHNLVARSAGRNVEVSKGINKTGERSPRDIVSFENMYVEGGADRIIKAVIGDSGSAPKAASLELIKVSRLATQSKFPEAEYAFVNEALKRNRSEQTLRGMYWAAQRAGRVREAWKVLSEIEELYGSKPTDNQSAWLTKARNGPIMNLGLLDEIVVGSKRVIQSTKNRVSYVLHNSLPYSSGGYATRAHGLVTGLRNIGIETICVTRPGYPFDVKPDLEGTSLPDSDEIDEIQYHRLWEPKRGGNALSRYVRGAADAFESKFRLDRPAIVIAASAHLSALPALIAARRLGLPFIYEVRGFWEITRLSREPEFARRPYYHVQKLMEAEVAIASDHVFTLTEPMKAELMDRGVPADMISLLPNSCDPDRFIPRDRDDRLAARLGIPVNVPVIGYIGTFVQYEGLDHLAEACAVLQSRGLNFRLLLVGNEDTSNEGRGPITEKIEHIANEGRFAEWLIMPGRVPHDEVESYYSLIDIAPFPRKPQPVTEMVSPMKPLEALAMEKAVVVSSVRALVEFISHGNTGVVFEKGDVGALADALACLVQDKAMRTRLGKAAREWVISERTWSASADKARAVIHRVIDANASLPPSPQLTDTAGRLGQSSVSSLTSERDEIFQTVRELYSRRDKNRKKPSYSTDDWERTRLVFSLLEGATSIIDIGIGQAQLTNLLARCADVERLYGYDFRDYKTRINPPPTKNYRFKVWDITKELDDKPEKVDVVVAMEVLEHLPVKAVPDVFDRLKGMSSSGAMLITVPYKEKEPLYHHDRKHGHRQSFDDSKVEQIFGPCLYSSFKQKWYFVFVHDSLSESTILPFELYLERVHTLITDATIRADGLKTNQ